MLQSIHEQIVRRALADRFTPEALQDVIRANVGQDALRGQFGHDEFHFDNNAFEPGRRYIAAQRALVFAALRAGQAATARSAFGRLTHAAQDFYAHSNYVDLWLGRRPESPPAAIDALDANLLTSPELRSGKVYYPQEALYFVPGLRALALAILPRDSHAHMNLDSAERGARFEYAFAAAVKRTAWEFECLRSGAPEDELILLTGSLKGDDARPVKNVPAASGCMIGIPHAA
jgi:hypothetical protein